MPCGEYGGWDSDKQCRRDDGEMRKVERAVMQCVVREWWCVRQRGGSGKGEGQGWGGEEGGVRRGVADEMESESESNELSEGGSSEGGSCGTRPSES